MILYHGSRQIVEYPEIRKTKYNKDFYFGFYCTRYEEQAKRWAARYGVNGYLIIVACRSGKSHKYDIVEGPMADDTIYNYVQNYMDGKISRAAFWELAKFKYPTHQISFHTVSALDTLKFIGSEVVYGNKE